MRRGRQNEDDDVRKDVERDNKEKNYRGIHTERNGN